MKCSHDGGKRICKIAGIFTDEALAYKVATIYIIVVFDINVNRKHLMNQTAV